MRSLLIVCTASTSTDQLALSSLSYLKPDAADEYLDLPKLRSLIQKHAEYNAAPIYLWTSASLDPSVNAVPVVEAEDDEIKVEDEATAVEQPKWDLVNDRPPLWMRDSKDVTEEEYEVRNDSISAAQKFG